MNTIISEVPKITIRRAAGKLPDEPPLPLYDELPEERELLELLDDLLEDLLDECDELWWLPPW